jgi:gamma-glutamyl:cysteine ligase YbdK (ATP-grasp superfamily)
MQKKSTLCAPQGGSDRTRRVCMQKNTLRAPQGGSDQTLLSPAESDQKAAASKKKKICAPSRGNDRSKKMLCALQKATRKKSARQTLLQLTDLREQDRFNRSTMPVQPLLTRMVLVKTG